MNVLIRSNTSPMLRSLKVNENVEFGVMVWSKLWLVTVWLMVSVLFQVMVSPGVIVIDAGWKPVLLMLTWRLVLEMLMRRASLNKNLRRNVDVLSWVLLMVRLNCALWFGSSRVIGVKVVSGMMSLIVMSIMETLRWLVMTKGSILPVPICVSMVVSLGDMPMLVE